jgi:sialic acid synthase SpsE
MFIAEVSSNHAQDLNRCLDFIKASYEIGCDAVKFQMFTLDQLFSKEARESNPEFEKRRNWELPEEFLPILKSKCDELGILFSCTPFYIDAVDLLKPHVDFFKIASYELLWDDLLIKIASTQKKVILSTGMANMKEILHAVKILKSHGATEIEILHCISGYPTPLEDCNLSAIETLRNETGLDVGWSDHSVNAIVIFEAVTRWGASSVEFHLDLDGLGDEYKTGHCWLPQDIAKVIKICRDPKIITGTGEKVAKDSEKFDRKWRADPADGLRPLVSTRNELAKFKRN